MAIQKNGRPKLEDVINSVLNGEEQKNAFSFVSYLRANKLSPVWAAENSWKVSYKNKGVCFIRVAGAAHYHHLENGTWHISFIDFDRNHRDFVSDESSKEIIWKNIKYCLNCSKCRPGTNMNILGRDFENVCNGWFVMRNPDEQSLEYAKKVVEYKKTLLQLPE